VTINADNGAMREKNNNRIKNINQNKTKKQKNKNRIKNKKD